MRNSLAALIRSSTAAAFVLGAALPGHADVLFKSIPDLTVAPALEACTSCAGPQSPYQVYDAFSLSGDSTIQAIQFELLTPSIPSSLEIEIFSPVVSGLAVPSASLFSQTFTSADYSIGPVSAFDTHTVTIDFSGPTLASGDYVISLFNATLLDIPTYTGGSGLALQHHDGTTPSYTELSVNNGVGTSIGFELDGVPAATPLPATLPLFASGLGALGLLGWRRKRKAQAAA